MKFLSTFVLLAALSVFAEAASFHPGHVHRSNHNGISRRANSGTRRCKNRPVRIHRGYLISQILTGVLTSGHQYQHWQKRH